MSCRHYERAVELAAALANRRPCGCRGFDVAEWALSWLGFGGATFGVESVWACDGSSLRCLNAGDTYDLTVCREGRGEFFAGSWGEWIEGREQEYDEENDTTQCGYCSHHTPIEGDDWRNTVCENCGHCVSG